MDEEEKNRIEQLISIYEKDIKDKKELISSLIDDIAVSRITLEKFKFIDGFLMGVISYLLGFITIPFAIFVQSFKIVNLFSDDIGIEFTVVGVSFIAYMVLLIFFIIKYKKSKELKHLYIIFILFLYPAFQMGKMFDTFTGF